MTIEINSLVPICEVQLWQVWSECVRMSTCFDLIPYTWKFRCYDSSPYIGTVYLRSYKIRLRNC